MQEAELGRQGIRIEMVQHGRYWGYLVVQDQDGELPSYFGKSKKSEHKTHCDAFSYRARALRFAKSLAGDPAQIYEEQEIMNFFDHLWIDHGGES